MASVQEEQERVLAEVAHDLANRFHRYYYYQELGIETVADAPAEGRQLLAKALETVEGIESLTRATMAFLRRMELRTIPVRAEDVIGSLRQHLSDRALEVVSGLPAGSAMVSVDPARIGEVLSTCCSTLLSLSSDGSPLHLEVGGEGCLELRLSIVSTSPVPSSPDLSLAMAHKILSLHGGGLVIPTTSRSGTAALTVRLPLAAQE